MARIQRDSDEDGLRKDVQAAIDATNAARDRGASENEATEEAIKAHVASMRRRGLHGRADHWEKDWRNRKKPSQKVPTN